MKTTIRALAVCGGLLALAFPGAALAVGETTGSVSGYVYDPTNAPLSDVPLTISGPALLAPISRVSDENGRFTFSPLPPGDGYAIEVKVPGYTPIRQTGISVRLGQTSSVDVNLTVLTETSAAQTFQIVEKVNPIMNTESTQAATVVTAEKAAGTPQFTQTEGIPQEVAGTSFSNKPVTRGGLARYGRFYVDGLDTTDITDGSMTGVINFYTVENFDVVTGGFDAQYNSLGMVENVVTKSGSNHYTFDLVGTLSPPFLTAQNLVPSPQPAYVGLLTNTLQSGPQTSFYSPVVSVGGPIVDDKLWFYASYQINLSHKETSLQPYKSPLENRPTDTVTQVGRLKLTWQPTTKDRVSMTVNIDHNTIDNSTGSSAVTLDAETKIDRGGVMLIGNWDHNISDTTLFQLQAGMTWKNVNNDPERYDPNNPLISHTDTFNGITSFAAGRLGFGQDENYLHDGKLRVQFDPSLLWKAGSHQMKAGVQVEYMRDTQIQGVTGNQRYTDHGGVCDPNNAGSFGYCFERTDFYSGVDANGNGVNLGGPLTLTAQALNLGAYIQDRWAVTRRLTLVPGFRVDTGILNGDPTANVSIPTLIGFGPRFGGTYDVTGERKYLLTAYYGRSNDVGDINIAQHANPALLEVNSFFNSTTGTFPACTPNTTTNPGNGACQIVGGANGRSFLPNQAPPYVDEIQVGYHQEFAPQTVIGVDLDYRHYGKMWVDAEVNRIWDPSGQKIIGYRNGIPQTILLTQTTPQAFRNYEGIDLWIQGNPGNWDLYVAYTLSFNHGTVSEYFDGYLQNPRMTNFAYGYLGDDHRHTLKASLMYTFPNIGLRLGMRPRYQTGAPVWETFQNPADANLNFYRSPRGVGYAINSSTNQPNFNDPTSQAQIIAPDWFQVDLQATYDLGRALGIKQHIELEAFVLDALNDYNGSGISGTFNTTGTNRFGYTSFHNGPLQGEIILRFRN